MAAPAMVEQETPPLQEPRQPSSCIQFVSCRLPRKLRGGHYIQGMLTLGLRAWRLNTGNMLAKFSSRASAGTKFYVCLPSRSKSLFSQANQLFFRLEPRASSVSFAYEITICLSLSQIEGGGEGVLPS